VRSALVAVLTMIPVVTTGCTKHKEGRGWATARAIAIPID